MLPPHVGDPKLDFRRFAPPVLEFRPAYLDSSKSDSRAPSQNGPRERFSFRSVLKTMLGAPRVLFNQIYHISFYTPGILIQINEKKLPGRGLSHFILYSLPGRG